MQNWTPFVPGGAQGSLQGWSLTEGFQGADLWVLWPPARANRLSLPEARPSPHGGKAPELASCPPAPEAAKGGILCAGRVFKTQMGRQILHQASTWAKPGSQNGLVRQRGWKVYALWEKGVLHPNVSWDLEPVFWILPCRGCLD